MAELNEKTVVAILTKGHPTKTQTKVVTENGTILPDEGYDAFSSVTVNVSLSGETGSTGEPLEANSEEEMSVLLLEENGGMIVKYTGDTATYENGRLYLIEVSDLSIYTNLLDTATLDNMILG